MLSSKDRALSLEMFRRLAVGDFDDTAFRWLVKNKATAEAFMMEHFDLLCPPERIAVYSFLGLFPKESVRRVIDFRMKAERDPECKRSLVEVKQRYEAQLREPPVDLLARCEKQLEDESPRMRCIGAMGYYALTRKTQKIIPVLLAILRNRSSEGRVQAAEVLGMIRCLDAESIHGLEDVANDLTDPVQSVAETSLKAHRVPGGLLKRLLKRISSKRH